MEHEILDVILKTGGTLASGAVRGALFRIFRHVILNQPDHVIERVFNSFSSAQEYNDKKLQCGETLRGDWYYDNDNHVKFAEDMVRQTISDTQGKKSEYITKFHVNIRFSSNDDIDEHTAFSYLEVIESLSWRQLCIIRLAILYENQEVNSDSVPNEEYLKQMPQDEQTRFYSIGREFQKLMDDHYIQSVGMLIDENTNDPFWEHPIFLTVPAYTRRLHSLMNLHEIPDEEIVQTFSPWNVRLKKTEEDSR